MIENHALPAEFTIDGRIFDLVPFLKEGESYVSGDVLAKRAEELNANVYGEEDGQFILEHQDKIPAVLRGKIFLVFMSWRKPSSSSPQNIACLDWYGTDNGWCRRWSWIDIRWGGGHRLVRRRPSPVPHSGTVRGTHVSAAAGLLPARRSSAQAGNRGSFPPKADLVSRFFFFYPFIFTPARIISGWFFGFQVRSLSYGQIFSFSFKLLTKNKRCVIVINPMKKAIFFAKFATFSLILSAGLGFLAQKSLAQTPLTIENIEVDFVSKNVLITWDTNQSSTGRVDYSTDAYYKEHEEYRFSVQHGGPENSRHVITLIGLQEKTTYHFKITSKTKIQETHTFDQTFKTDKFEDNTTPIISRVRVEHVTGKTATIQWETDEPADSKALFGKTQEYGKSSGSASRVTQHDITISGLNPGTLYHFTVQSKDKDHNTALYTDDTFRTEPTDLSDRRTAEIFDVHPSTVNDPGIRHTTTLISWRTNRPATGVVRYGTERDRLNKSVTLSAPRTFLHIVTLTDLEPDRAYYFTLESRDVLGKVVKTEVRNFRTRGRDTDGAASPNAADRVDGNAGVVLGESYSQIPQAVSRAGASFYVNFDNGFDADLAFGNRSGLPINVILSENGRSGNAADLSVGGAVRYASALNFNPEHGTIAFWFKPQWGKKRTKHYVFTINPDPVKNNDKFFHIYIGNKNTLHFEMEDDKDQDYLYSLDGIENLNNENWQFVAVTWEYDGGSARIYYNNKKTPTKLRTQGGNTAKPLGMTPKFGEHFFIGSTNPYTSNVLLDEFVIFNRVLRQDEVETLYESGAGVFFEPTPAAARVPHPVPVPQTTQGVVLGVSFKPYTPASALYKIKNRSEVYALINGKKFHITSPSSFEEYGYRWSDIMEVSKEFLDGIEDVRLVKTPNSPKVYYRYKRSEARWLKLAIPSPDVFESYPNNRWGDVVTIHEIDLDSYTEARLVKLPNDQRVYYLEGGNRRPIDSWQTFVNALFQAEYIVGVNQAHLESYQLGEALR